MVFMHVICLVQVHKYILKHILGNLFTDARTNHTEEYCVVCLDSISHWMSLEKGLSYTEKQGSIAAN